MTLARFGARACRCNAFRRMRRGEGDELFELGVAVADGTNVPALFALPGETTSSSTELLREPLPFRSNVSLRLRRQINIDVHTNASRRVAEMRITVRGEAPPGLTFAPAVSAAAAIVMFVMRSIGAGGASGGMGKAGGDGGDGGGGHGAIPGG